MWYSARLLFESQRGDSRGAPPLRDEVIKLVEAVNDDEALQKALKLGKADETEYSNDEGSVVRWKFLDVLDIQDLCEETLYDGVDVYSRLSWRDESDPEGTAKWADGNSV